STHLLTPALFPYTTLFRSSVRRVQHGFVAVQERQPVMWHPVEPGVERPQERGQDTALLVPVVPLLERPRPDRVPVPLSDVAEHRSEEHTSELQSRENLVCR